MSYFNKKAIRPFIRAILLTACPFNVSLAEINFEDKTFYSGMSYIGVTWSTSWGDANGDGLQDIFVSNHGTSNNKFPTLYINQGNGTFLQRAQQFFPYKYRDFHGSSWADFDNDGDLDIFISSGGSRGALRDDKKEAAEDIDDNVFWVKNQEV